MNGRALIAALLLGLAAPAHAQRPTGPARTAPLVGGGEPQRQSFQITMGSGASTSNRGMIGGGGGFVAMIHMAPRYEAPGDGKLYLALDDRRVTKQVVKNDAPGGLALLGWEFALMDINSPSSRITGVRAVFNDNRTVSGVLNGSVYEFEIPRGARGIDRFEVDWSWLHNRRTLTFLGGVAPRRYELLGLLAAVTGAGLLARKRWLAVRLVDERGKPIASERFEVRLPDGSIHDGRLDTFGFALVTYESPAARAGAAGEALDAILWRAAGGAPCEVRFPDLEKGEVRASGTADLNQIRAEGE